MTAHTTAARGPRRVSAHGRRWCVPGLLAAAMIAGAVVIPETASASGKPSLEAIGTEALVASVLATKASAFSGTFTVTSNLGLPDLSDLAGGVNASALSFLSGTHTAQVWYGGVSKLRVAIPSGTGQADFIMNGSTAYLWQSAPYTVTKFVLGATFAGSLSVGSTVPAPPSTEVGHSQSVAAAPLTPDRLAAELLSDLGPSTAVKVGSTAYVAGRPAYELVVSPRTDQSLIGQVVISVDASTGLPLRVQVTPRGSTTALLTFGFTQISYAAPAASNFEFTPPPGATLTTVNPITALLKLGSLDPIPLLSQCSGCWVAYAPPSDDVSAETPSVVGSGWTTVAVVPTGLLGALDQIGAAGKTNTAAAVRSTVSALIASGPTVSGPWGKGHLIHTALLNMLAVTNGPILIGAVTPATLEAAAAHAS